MNWKKDLSILAAGILVSAALLAQSKNDTSRNRQPTGGVRPLVTFVELGSVRCIPCRQMQPIMKAVEEKYGSQLRVLFHDVWKPDQKAAAEKYGIRVIPTQVFLDAEGKEFFRHEGFFPEAEIDRLLQKRGLVPGKGS